MGSDPAAAAAAALADPAVLPFAAAVNAVYALLSLLLGLLAVKLYRDRWRDWRAVRRQAAPAEQDLALTRHDLELETVRFAKQVLSVLMLWLPVLWRPVLEDGHDRPLFEVLRAGVFVFMFGLLFNSYRSLSFRRDFRRRWGRRPRPLT